MLTLVGTGGGHPPRHQAGFDAFARSLRDPMLSDLIAAGRPSGPISVFGATANRYRHFERLRDRPAGFLVTGDAACAFNPIYGQGMSAAAFAADTLGACLRRDSNPAALSHRFPFALAKAVKVPWMLATAADFEVAGIRPPLRARTMNRYVARVMDAGVRSPAARVRLLEVRCMTRPPQTLFAPDVIAAALRRPTPPEDRPGPPSRHRPTTSPMPHRMAIPARRQPMPDAARNLGSWRLRPWPKRNRKPSAWSEATMDACLA